MGENRQIMDSLQKIITLWKAQGLLLHPPAPEAAVRGTFALLGSHATSDVVRLYTTVGGMDTMDDEYWCLWPLSQIEKENQVRSPYGLQFSDFCIDCWRYRLKPNDDDTSAVLFDGCSANEVPLQIARTLDEFFDTYARDPDEILCKSS